MPPEKRKVQVPISDEVLLPSSYDERGDRDFLSTFIVLAKHKFFVLSFVAAGGILATIVAFILPAYYAANVKLLPPQQSQSIASAMLGQLGPLVGALAGKNLGARNPTDPYLSMLHSRAIADKIIDHFSLMRVYRKKWRADARNRLDALTDITVGKDGVISISVEDRDPGRAADIANAYVSELEKLTRTLAVSDAAKRRMFFEHEVTRTREELANAEVALKQTMESTGIIHLDNQSKVMLDTFANIRAQVAAKEVQVQVMRSFATPQNPDLISAAQELSALRAQVAKMEQGQAGWSVVEMPLQKVPSAGLEYIRKLREVKYREALFELLAKQYEAARIDEAKESATIQVLDKAVPPEKRSWPLRAFVIACGTVLALLVAVVWVHLRETIEHAKEDPTYLAQLQILKIYLQEFKIKRSATEAP